jgi:hypothetical protein
MYTVYLINFGYELDQTFRSYTSALAKAVQTGFECVVRCNGRDLETVKPI